MPDAMGEKCVERLDHCLDQELATQPAMLGVEDNLQFYCRKCEEGYFWSSVKRICDVCSEGCSACENPFTCSACFADHNLLWDNTGCTPKIQNCAVPMSV